MLSLVTKRRHLLFSIEDQTGALDVAKDTSSLLDYKPNNLGFSIKINKNLNLIGGGVRD